MHMRPVACEHLACVKCMRQHHCNIYIPYSPSEVQQPAFDSVGYYKDLTIDPPRSTQ
jgi:hypothetical protein